MSQSIGATATFAKTVGVWVSRRLGYGCEGQRVERLHSAVVQGGDAQGAKLAVFLRYIDSAQGLGFVSVTLEVICGLEFLSIRSPSYVIYPRSVGTPVGCHSPYGHESGRARVCQQPLQSRSSAALAELNRLGNTHLQPSNLLLKGSPGDCLPEPWPVERRISSGWNCHLLFFLCDGSACSLARRDRDRRGHIRRVTAGLGFFGRPKAAALDPPCGKVCPARTRRASNVSMFHNNPE